MSVAHSTQPTRNVNAPFLIELPKTKHPTDACFAAALTHEVNSGPKHAIRKIAEAVGVNKATISQMRKAGYHSGYPTKKAVAEYLNYDLAEFITFGDSLLDESNNKAKGKQCHMSGKLSQQVDQIVRRGSIEALQLLVSTLNFLTSNLPTSRTATKGGRS